MTSKNDATPLAAVVGENLLRLRLTADKTQDEMVRVLRAAGIEWSRVTLGQVERGERPITFAEVLLLAADGIAAPAELLSGAGSVDLGDGQRRRLDVLRNSLAAEPGGAAGGHLASASATAKSSGRAAVRQPPGEAEDKAARKFGVTVEQVDRAASFLWRRSLTAERDRRMARFDEPMTPRVRQARRGHVTRELLAEIEPAIDDLEVKAGLPSSSERRRLVDDDVESSGPDD